MSQTVQTMLAQGVCFEYRADRPILRGVDLAAAAGNLTCILGPNGCGKTTLLRCLLGQLAPSSGEILLDGRAASSYSPAALARLMAYVPQLPRSSFAFTVRQLVLMGRFARMGMLGITTRGDLDIAREAMKMTDTDQFAERTLDELSGGEAQRVMIARALAQQPSVMLLDEPTSHLDIRNQLAIYRMMQRLAHDWQMAVICVSHDVNLAARFADRLVLMRDGAVVAAGTGSDVIHRRVLRDVYDVEVDLIDPHDGSPAIVRAR